MTLETQQTIGPPPLPPPPPDDGGDGPYGDGEPRRPGPPLSNASLAILMVLGSETMFFAALIAAFLFLRLSHPTWSLEAMPNLPLLVTGINSLLLLYSAYTMRLALRALRQWKSQTGARYLLLSVALGSIFLAIQGYEWVQLVRYGLTLSAGVYGASFYVLIGSHGLHVLGAVIWLLVVTVKAFISQDEMMPRPLGVTLCGLYWYYVVALWSILFTLVYLV
ncbi:MAG: hypothetical protein ETSY1_22385 [Candidatus Entotheonella factor]|uniref:Heme-copper oxidase subunit III family profile domain-containing protein n=1 Tax=Entotheonella factor TaxID=1429438 RepID=W4LHW0_ENTF1|nr:MAG: hypothetical protein ETSY1_22385 [Candidatus Entotheonella factor]